MNWYYANQGQQNGPIPETQLDELFQTGKISNNTLVWREGLAAWEPYETARSATIPPPRPLGAAGPNEIVCTECGRAFPPDETIAYGNSRVCASCKPHFLQKLKEGVTLETGALNYAPNGIRVGAYVIDVVIMSIFNFVMSLVMGMMGTLAKPEPGHFSFLPLLIFAVQISVAIFYESVMVWKFGGTLGKLALKIKVVTSDGQPLTYGRSLGRYFAKILAGAICLIGFLIAFSDPEKRALQDRICNTRVVIK